MDFVIFTVQVSQEGTAQLECAIRVVLSECTKSTEKLKCATRLLRVFQICSNSVSHVLKECATRIAELCHTYSRNVLHT